MDATSKELLISLREQHSMMVQQLHQFCEINSGSDNLAGLEAMQRKLADTFTPLGDQLETLVLPAITSINMQGDLTTQRCGDALLIRKRTHLSRRILLAGHMDTVYSPLQSFQTLTYVNDNQVNGPGVADMKGGLIVMLHALSCFEQSPAAADLGWDVLINADEEIGSPASSALFDELALQYQAALVYEPAMTIHGTFAKNRKGSGKLTLVATGKAAHAGRAFEEGRNAICYLAEVVTAVHALNGKRQGVTLNIGKIAGGEALNVVPDKAVAKIDVRISKPNDADWVMAEFHRIIANFNRQDYSLTVHGGFARPVKRVCHATQRLFNRLGNIGKSLGLAIHWEDSGGCCDGNNLAHHGLAVIDTLGVRGGAIHSFDEFILLDSLVERASLSALLLIDLAKGGLEELSQ